MVPVVSKPWYQSRTLWLAVLTFVAGLVGFLQADEFVAEYPQVVAGLGIALAVVQVALRFLTSRPIKLR